MHAEAITFRAATPEDTPMLAALSARAFREAYQAVWEDPGLSDYISRAFTPEQIGAELADPNATFILLSRNGQPAGYAKLRRGHNPPDLDGVAAVQIQRFYLLSAHYGRGLGDHLMEHCLTTARQEGFATIWLAVWPENTRAVKFYQRWGFAVTGSYPFYHGNEVAQDWLMQRAVSNPMITVTCAIIEHEGKVLAARRGAAMSQPLRWEFPGGKVEPGESLHACIAREIAEELGVAVAVGERLPDNVHDYGNGKVIRLVPFRCRLLSHAFALKEHEQIRWLTPAELPGLDWAPADVPIVEQYVKRDHA